MLNIVFGSFNWVTIDLYMIKLNFFLTANGIKLQALNYKLRFNTETYEEICNEASYALTTVDVRITSEADVNNCLVGFLGTWDIGRRSNSDIL